MKGEAKEYATNFVAMFEPEELVKFPYELLLEMFWHYCNDSAEEFDKFMETV